MGLPSLRCLHKDGTLLESQVCAVQGIDWMTSQKKKICLFCAGNDDLHLPLALHSGGCFGRACLHQKGDQYPGRRHACLREGGEACGLEVLHAAVLVVQGQGGPAEQEVENEAAQQHVPEHAHPGVVPLAAGQQGKLLPNLEQRVLHLLLHRTKAVTPGPHRDNPFLRPPPPPPCPAILHRPRCMGAVARVCPRELPLGAAGRVGADSSCRRVRGVDRGARHTVRRGYLTGCKRQSICVLHLH